MLRRAAQTARGCGSAAVSWGLCWGATGAAIGAAAGAFVWVCAYPAGKVCPLIEQIAAANNCSMTHNWGGYGKNSERFPACNNRFQLFCSSDEVDQIYASAKLQVPFDSSGTWAGWGAVAGLGVGFVLGAGAGIYNYITQRATPPTPAVAVAPPRVELASVTIVPATLFSPKNPLASQGRPADGKELGSSLVVR